MLASILHNQVWYLFAGRCSTPPDTPLLLLMYSHKYCQVYAAIIISLFKCKLLWNDTLRSTVLQRNLRRKCNPREFHFKRLQKCPISSTKVFLISVFLEYFSFVSRLRCRGQKSANFPVGIVLILLNSIMPWHINVKCHVIAMSNAFKVDHQIALIACYIALLALSVSIIISQSHISKVSTKGFVPR